MKDKRHVVIFDFDGVIVDSIAVMFSGMQEIYKGLTIEEFKEAAHMPIDKMKIEFAEAHGEYKPNKKEQEAYKNRKVKTTKLHRGMKTVLKDVSEHYFVALNTNAREENCTALLQKLDIRKYFDVVEVGGDGRSKVEKNESIMSDLGVTPIEALFVTDTGGDVLDAEAAGVPSIGVTWGVHSREDFEEGEIGDGIIAIVDSAEELYDAISNHFN